MVVDEDDPFGIGGGGASQAIAAALKPEKGRLQKVVCPMCEQVGFVPKAALGKPVKCANVKCMVPIFTAEDPAEQKAERRPTRLADEAEAIRRAAEASAPRKRNPLLIYGIGGAVLLGLTAVVVPLLTKKPDTTALQTPRDLSSFEELAAAEEAEAKAKAAAAAAAVQASAQSTPAVAVEEQVKRMTVLARQELRDKPLARRMTGDIWLRLGNSKEAATELSQLLVVDRSRSFYRVIPQAAHYWRSRAAGDAAAAKVAFAACESEIAGKTLPRTGRAATEVCLAFAAMLVQEGRQQEAQQLLATRQLDRTIPDNLDSMVSVAWLFVSSNYRDLGLTPPYSAESYLWSDPLHVAVASVLGLQGSWQEVSGWAAAGSDARVAADALVAAADAGMRTTGAAAAGVLMSAADAITVPGLSLRVRAALAGAAGDAAGVDACVQRLSMEAAAGPSAMPGLSELAQRGPVTPAATMPWGLAAAEIARGLILTGRSAAAGPLLARSSEFLGSVAPPTAELRLLMLRLVQDRAAVQEELSEAAREKNEQKLEGLMRNLDSRVRLLSTAAEDRRATQLLLLARLMHAGGREAVLGYLESAPPVMAEVQLDAIRNVLYVAGLQAAGGLQEPTKLEVLADSKVLESQQREPQAGTIAPQVWGLGRSSALPLQSSADTWSNVYFNAEAGFDEASGMRLAMLCERTRWLVQQGQFLQALEGIQKLQNGLWREETWQIAGRTMADGGREQDLLTWVAGKKIGSLEQICLLYGLSQGLADRAGKKPAAK
ncbi:MAG TPA: hypothetical protein DIT89_11660 [Planctomycetaceae bacterium]|nr:hypothetical protein [Planctomycetaceae bacterium]